MRTAVALAGMLAPSAAAANSAEAPWQPVIDRLAADASITNLVLLVIIGVLLMELRSLRKQVATSTKEQADATIEMVRTLEGMRSAITHNNGMLAQNLMARSRATERSE